MADATIDWGTLAGRMIEARVRAGLTRRQASLAAGYSSVSTISRYEGDEIMVPREEVVFRFADVYAERIGSRAEATRLWVMYGRGEIGWAG
jgi:transcriptional regulator with XRE-family HTH domain